MKLLLIGPYPPPHGGISVHVMEARNNLAQAGVEVRVLNSHRGAPRNDAYLRYRGLPGLLGALISHARQGWIFHVHINGHNRKSWQLALLCGLAGRLGPGTLLTLHSGMTPAYLRSSRWHRLVARAVCSLYDRVIGVNAEIQAFLSTSGVAADRTEILPAYLVSSRSDALPERVESFLQDHWPVFSTVLFFRPEYGFDFLLKALALLRSRYPKAGCVVMGDGETSIEARLAILKENVGDALLLLGDVPHDVCLAVMSRSHVFLRCTSADGDSISVREALSSGVPVVATNVGTRPPGALLFPVGDLAAFLSRVKLAMRSDAVLEPDDTGSSAGGYQRLLQLYRQVLPEQAKG